MKNARLFGLVALLVFALAQVSAGTVWFVNDQDWDHVSVYCAVGDEWARPITRWPGIRILPTEKKVNGHTVYEFEYDDRKGYDRIIFNNDSVGQTQNLVLEPGKIYYAQANRWFDSIDEIPSVDQLPSDTVYFVNLAAWPKVLAYAAVGENWRPQNKVWPGQELVNTGRKFQNGDVYIFTYPRAMGYDHLIFNCSECGEQTLDLVPESGRYFVCTRTKTGAVEGKWVAPAAPAQKKPQPQRAPASRKPAPKKH